MSIIIRRATECDSEKIKMTMSTPLGSMNLTPEDNDYGKNGKEELFMLLPVRTKDL